MKKLNYLLSDGHGKISLLSVYKFREQLLLTFISYLECFTFYQAQEMLHFIHDILECL